MRDLNKSEAFTLYRYNIFYSKQSIMNPNIDFQVGMAQKVGIESNSIDAVVLGITLNFVPQPETVIAEMLRVAKPGGKEFNLKKVSAIPVEERIIFKNFEDYWLPFLGKVGLAPSYIMSLKEKRSTEA